MTETNQRIFHSWQLCSQLALALAGDDSTGPGDRWGDALIADALRERVTDIHFEPLGEAVRVRFRVDGALHDVATLEPGAGQRLMRYFKANADLDPVSAGLPTDARMQFEADGKAVDVRVACAPCVTGERMTLRILQHSRVAMRLTELGLADDQRAQLARWLSDLNGMLLVAGPTGSGKTTTLYALLAEMQLMQHAIVTVEDPVECQIPGVSQMQVDTKRGLTFAEGVRSILRLDPDYILVGEIRDHESADAAFDAANTGHVLLSTLHSRAAAGVVTVLRNLDVRSHDIATSLTFVLSQRLVRKLCAACRREEKPREADARWLRAIGRSVPKSVWGAPGCKECKGSGYMGRTGVFEVWPLDEKSYDLILAKVDEHALRDHLRESGVRSLLWNGLEKAAAGVTDLAEVRTMGVRSDLEQVPAASAART